MKELKITKKDLDDEGYYKEDSLNFDGTITSEKNLGYVKFKKELSATKGIYFKAGSGIEAGWGIKAGYGIEAGSGIKAGWGIKAGCGIEAGYGIEAGSGILSNLFIKCKKILKFNYSLCAGIKYYGPLKEGEDLIECGKLEGDKSLIRTGKLVELGLKKEESCCKQKEGCNYCPYCGKSLKTEKAREK